MKRKLFTTTPRADLLKKIDLNTGPFTADEHAYLNKQEYGDKFLSRDKLLRWNLSQSNQMLTALDFFIMHLIETGFTNILSLGSGKCVTEYLLQCALPDLKVIATDFDSYLIDKAKNFFPNIISIRFDFIKDILQKLQNDLSCNFDIAVFFGSSYVMDDSEFVHLFNELKRIGVKEIIDFHAGYMDFRSIIYHMGFLLFNKIIRILRIKKLKLKDEVLRKFHGYTRSRSELRRLYKESDLNLVQEISVGTYKYVAICNCL